MKTALSLAAALIATGLAGCNTLTPAQNAAIFCVLSADGTAIATAATSGGAQAAAAKLGAASVVACHAATNIGQIVTK